MASKHKKGRFVVAKNEFPDFKKHQLHNTCGYCSMILSGKSEDWLAHIESHKSEITMCRLCRIVVKLEDRETHLEMFHEMYHHCVKFELNESLIEIRIPLGKGFSNFWAFKTDDDWQYRYIVKRGYQKFKDGRSVGVFRVSSKTQKFQWGCPICETFPRASFNETIGMRAFALRHLEEFHRSEIDENMPGLLENEWHQLEEDTDFDIRTLMHIAKHRLKMQERSFLTFYTLKLSALENGQNFQNILETRSGMEKESSRFCLVCFQLVPTKSIKTHFLQLGHSNLKAVSESTAFTYVANSTSEPVEGEEESFKFPQDLFVYTTVFKNVRQDEYKWRCCLCPHSRSKTFVTSIVLRMFVLRHIDEHHKFLFTDDFLSFEWESLKRQMRISFDIRTYSPIQYTAKGESTFKKTDPNDFVLPQQYFFLPKQSLNNTLICGFCYRSLDRTEFHLHIVLHGFETMTKKTPSLKPVVINNIVKKLMGQAELAHEEPDDESHKILSIEGERLQRKIERLNEVRYGESVGHSEVTTPARSDVESGSRTPMRQSALNARKMLTDTFNTLQQNLNNWKENGSSSSSSDDENSEDEQFEKTMEAETGHASERKRFRSREHRTESRNEEHQNDSRRKEFQNTSEKRPILDKMKPAEIQAWIQSEARKRGIQYKDDSSDSSSSDESCDTNVINTQKDNKWDSMKLGDIKNLIKEAAIRKNVNMADGSSSSSSDEDDA